MEKIKSKGKSISLDRNLRCSSISKVRENRLKGLFKFKETGSFECLRPRENSLKRSIKLNQPTISLGTRKFVTKTVRKSSPSPFSKYNLFTLQQKTVCKELPIHLKSHFLTQQSPVYQPSRTPSLPFPPLSNSPKSQKPPEVVQILSKIKNSFNLFKRTHNLILRDFNL